MLNLKYIFDIFVIGFGNCFVYVVLLVVVEVLVKVYNLFFIYGGVGFGKIYLMYVIGYYVIEYNLNVKVVYLLLEKFINEFINFICDNKVVDFCNKYCNVDVLLIDDI